MRCFPPLSRGAAKTLLISTLLSILFAVGCQRDTVPTSVRARHGGAAPNVSGGLPQTPGVATFDTVAGEALGDGIFVGAAKHYDNLTVFPILAKTQTDVGPLVSLNDALDKGTAEVRELGGDAEPQPGQPPRVQMRQPNEVDERNDVQQDNQVQQNGGSAQVGKLAIENRGEVPVYVLAGTIVKGGKQDRQVGQDFIIGAKSTVPIDAFCVEHGRWNGVRNGEATGGKFEAVSQLANRKVRVAGQYKKDQSEVWSKVSEVNEANKKHSSSDSLLATADDAEVKAQRGKLSRLVLADLDAVKPKLAVVGYAYAIDGTVMGVRWFAHHNVFGLFREVLVNTAIVDAITARAESEAAAKVAPLTARAVVNFVAEARTASAAAEVRETGADNTNEYTESADTYRSETVVESKGAGKKKVKMSVDFSKK